ncbi:hypothetical protein BYT27DRAFT_7297946 [Phlegmacium glaucopus]|nr:hypothetical protein BYT27DRAFT_7297946 [Phlegmacium glaucopus]
MEGVLLAALARPSLELKDLDAWVLHLQTHSLKKSTISGYSTGARDYLHFCQIHHISPDPTPQTLSRYIAFTSLKIASGPKYPTGAHHFLLSLYPDFDINRNNPLVQATIRGSKKVCADPVHRKQPIHINHLSSFVDAANFSGKYNDLLFATIMSCCYAGYHLPYHKTNPFFRGTDILFSTQEIASPVSLLKQFVCAQDIIHGMCSALFLSWFDSKLFTFVDRSFGGHSARAGGATFYASLGLSESIIMALGRWSTQAWKIYIRDNPSVRATIQLATT